jgi:hypothetical protein
MKKTTRKQLGVILLAGCTLALSQGVRRVAAAQGFTPLTEVAGTFSFTLNGSLALCLGNTPDRPPALCGSLNSTVVPSTLVEVGVYTFDTAGNACGILTETETASPVGTALPTVRVLHSVLQTTTYDPTTGQGDTSVTNYVGGQCTGATFDNTDGATVASNQTYHFALSSGGQRLDFVVTSHIPLAGLGTGGFSLSGTLLRQ